MRRIILFLLFISLMIVPVKALDFTAPEVLDSGQELMPESTESFGQGLLSIIGDAVELIGPGLTEASKTCLCLFAGVLLISFLQSFTGNTKLVTVLIGVLCCAGLLMQSTKSLLNLATETVDQISQYGKLLLPVMCAALSAQGGITAATALYTGTAFFNAILSSAITKVMVPIIYIFLALATANAVVGENLLKKMQDFSKWLVTWCLKTCLYVFTGYMGLTGVVSGTTDAAALKATKLTISGMVPVVGGILSDASESILVGAGVMKNAAGIYGILAILAVCVGPFIKIGIQYLLLKLTAMLCAMLDNGRISQLIQDFSTALGLLLGMTGSVSLLFMISTVCFLKGAA